VSEKQLYEVMCQLVAVLGGGFFIAFVVGRLQRKHPGLTIGRAVAVAFFVRVLAAFGLENTTSAITLRGGDETTFIGHAQALARWDFLSTATSKAFTHEFHVWFFHLNYRAFVNPPLMMIRIEVIAIAVCAVALLSAAVYELAGRRAAIVAAWLLAFEPANIFFSGILHKEPFMFMAEAMVAYGGARLWKRGDYTALVPMIGGCLLATATRPYVGWFLAAACAVIALHAGLRRNSASGSLVLSMVCLALMVAFVPTVLNASSPEKLKSLQISQDANATDRKANLSLESIDYSTRGKLVANLPKRMLEILTRPYPWQLANVSQLMGAFGTMFLFGVFALLGLTIVQHGGRLWSRAGPLMYPAIFLLMAYALSAGNAGTAFRYRTHVVALLVALVVVLRHDLLPERTDEEAHATGQLHPILGRSSVPTLAK
jgi:hypothetical protein